MAGKTGPAPDDDAGAFLQFEGMPPLSRGAFQLNGFATVNSIQDGHPGFVSDDYLNAIAAETTLAAAELEAAGMGERRPGGYYIAADAMLREAINFQEDLGRRAGECQERGAHQPDAAAEDGDGGDERRWIVCEHCGVPLQRPDGGPTGTADGGPLGPDPRPRTAP